MTKPRDVVRLELHGPAVTVDAAVDAGAAMVKLLHAVEEGLTGKEARVKWTLGPILFICDGCETERPTASLPPGWAYAEGNDYCPNCRWGGWQ